MTIQQFGHGSGCLRTCLELILTSLTVTTSNTWQICSSLHQMSIFPSSRPTVRRWRPRCPRPRSPCGRRPVLFFINNQLSNTSTSVIRESRRVIINFLKKTRKKQIFCFQDQIVSNIFKVGKYHFISNPIFPIPKSLNVNRVIFGKT